MAFETATRLKQIQLDSKSKGTGATVNTWYLPKTGFLASVYLRITATVAGTLSNKNALGASSIINRIRLQINNGIDVFNMTGAEYAYLANDVIDSEYFLGQSQNQGRSAVSAATFNLDTIIPVMVNPRDPIGLILLQNEQTQLTLTVEWAADATVATGATVTGSVTPYMEFFTVPANPKDYPRLDLIHQWIDQSQNVAGAGQQVVTIPRGGIYMGIYHGCGIGASGTDAWSRYQLRINQSDYLVDLDVDGINVINRRYRGRARAAGAILQDFKASSGLGSFGSGRDWLDSRAFTNIDSVVTATGATTLYTVYEQLLPIGGASS